MVIKPFRNVVHKHHDIQQPKTGQVMYPRLARLWVSALSLQLPHEVNFCVRLHAVELSEVSPRLQSLADANMT